MKHSILMMAALAGTLAMTSCSNDEVVEKSSMSAISFTAMANHSTRDANDGADYNEITTANFSFFRVYGYFRDHGSSNTPTQILSSEAVTKSGTSWSYENMAYWAPSNDYYFMAFSTNTQGERPWHYTFPTTNVADAFSAFQTNHGCGTLSLNYSASANDACRYDLVYAYAYRETDATVTDYTPVDLTFDHLLARIRFQFTNSLSNANSTLTISNLKIAGTPMAGSITFGSSNAYSDVKWVKNTDTGNVDVNIDTGNLEDIAITRNRFTQCRYLIPVNQALTVTFDVTWKISGVEYGKYAKTVTIPAMDFEKGQSYQFNANLTQDNLLGDDNHPIEFTVTQVNGWPAWGDGTDVTID